MIDIKSLLESLDIDYKESGSNVSKGWVNMTCPWCYDPSFHLGINLESNMFNCWICPAKGHIEKLIHQITKYPYWKVKEIIKEFETFDFPIEEKIIQSDKTLLKYDSDLKQIHKDYLIGRNFDPDFIQKKYHIGSHYKTGYFAYRIVIPIIEEGRIINLTGRDVTGKQERYLHLPNEKAIIPMKECIYNIDSVKDSMIICEGPLDVWRIGSGCIATMGTKYTLSQIKLIAERKPKNIFILFDSTALKESKELSSILSGIPDHLEILELDQGDPAEMSDREVNNLRKELKI